MDEKYKYLMAALVIIFGGNASYITSTLNPSVYRPDPFTGLEAAKLKEELINNHRKDADSFKVRINLLEYQIQVCQASHAPRGGHP